MWFWWASPLWKEFHTAAGATKEGDHYSGMTGQIVKPSTNIELVKVHQTIFKISHLGVHVSLHFIEFHLAIVRTVFHCQNKWWANNFTLISSRLNSGNCFRTNGVASEHMLYSWWNQDQEIPSSWLQDTWNGSARLYPTEPEAATIFYQKHK